MQHLRPALLLTAFFVLLTGVVFPVLVWGVGRIAFADQAGGSLIRDAAGNAIGSKLLGQAFGRPEYFHPRPSAAGAGYDAANSGATNLGPTSGKLVSGIPDDPATTHVDETYRGFRELARAYRHDNGLAPSALIPADAATRSASGLDPDISPGNAELQVARVSAARGMDADRVRALIRDHTAPRALGFIGEPRVNVLSLNLALDATK